MSRKALHLHLAHVRNQSNMHIQKGPALTSDTCKEPIQHACSKGSALTSNLVGTKSYTLVKIAPSPRLSYLVTDQVPPLSQRVVVALTSDLLVRMASTHIRHGRNLIL